MKSPHRFIATLFCSVFFLAAQASAAPTISFTTAKEKAAREGKVLLVDFTATWCMPCRWMDETTFADPQVLGYLRENYVSIKIDIDDFDGFALKQQYNVETLPTMIFFASDGQQIDRVEEGLGTIDMLARLTENDQPHNRRVLGGAAPEQDWSEPFARMSNTYTDEAYTAPTEYVAAQSMEPAQTPGLTASAVFGPASDSPTVLAEADHQPLEAPRMAYSVPAIETRTLQANAIAFGASALNGQQTPQVASAQLPALESEVEASVEADQAKPTPDATEVPAMAAANAYMFSLQAGAFSNQGNAVRAADHLRDYTSSPVLIEFDRANDKPVYRIYVGRFTDLKDAEALGKQLYMHGFSCVPKQLAMR